MFDAIQKRLVGALSKVRGKSRITEDDVKAVLAEIRTGLLEGDVHFKVAKDFLARVKERCMREEVIKSLTPEQQILKVLSDELTTILGGENRGLNLGVKPPAVILMCGLQGSGKTTTTAKLAQYLQDVQKKRVAVVSVDIHRPAAIEQLRQMAEKISVPVIGSSAEEKPSNIAKRALEEAKNLNADVLIVDSAGRIQIDDALMGELKDVYDVIEPAETLLVIDTMMGQQAVEVAEGFDQKIGITGSILSKLDGDSRGGAALSLVAITGKPIKFIGTGERPTDFEIFHPDRMASRILDMGDVQSLLEKAEMVISEEEATEAAMKLSGDNFTLEDFRSQMKMMSRMGSMGSIMKMLPGMGAMKEQLDQVDSDKEMKKINAIIDSMTVIERRDPDILNASRRRRVAVGCGQEVMTINQFLNKFKEARKMMKRMSKMGGMMKGLMGGEGSGGRGGGNPFGGGGAKKGGKGFGRKF